MDTIHFSQERRSREDFIENSIGNDGSLIAYFLVNRGHKNGKEIHAIYSSGVIVITNARTKRLVTKLIARPGQISRYLKGWFGMVEKSYNSQGQEVQKVFIPKEVWKNAYEHTKMGFNLK